MSRRDPLVLHGGLVGVVSVAAGLAAVAFTPGGAVRAAAVLGVVLCVGSAVVSLLLKRMVRSTQAAIAVVGLVFGARVVLVVVGALWAAKGWQAAIPFVAGFFGTYFPLQWVEISYLLAEAKRRDRLKKQTE